MKLIEGALFWADAGVPVFPCAENKRPLTANGFYDAETDPAKVKALFEFYDRQQNVLIGARMGKHSGLFALDFDLYKGAAPRDYMQDLIDSGALVDSRTHETQNGGLHVLYSSASDWPNLNPCTGVEIKGEGGYIIVPPSKGYKTLHEGLVDAPKLLLEKIRIERDIDKSKTVDDLKAEILNAGAFHEPLVKIAAKRAKQGYPQEQVFRELKDTLLASIASNPEHERHSRWRKLINNEQDELYRLMKSGYKKFSPRVKTDQMRERRDKIKPANDIFAKAQPDQFPFEGEVETDEEGKIVNPFATDGYFAHEDATFAKVNALVGNIIREKESMLLYAAPKQGKTAIALTMYFHLATGFDLGKLAVKEMRPVLYLALEGTVAIKQRISAMKRYYQEQGIDMPKEIPMFVLERPVDLTKEENRINLANEIKQFDEYCMETYGTPLAAVCVDTLTKSMPGGDQNDVKETSKVFNITSQLRARGVVANVGYVHHAKKANGMVRGSSDIEAEVDITLKVDKDEKRGYKLFVEAARSIEEGEEWWFETHPVELEIDFDKSIRSFVMLPKVESEEEQKAYSEHGVSIQTAKLRAGIMRALIELCDEKGGFLNLRWDRFLKVLKQEGVVKKQAQISYRSAEPYLDMIAKRDTILWNGYRFSRDSEDNGKTLDHIKVQKEQERWKSGAEVETPL